MKPKTKEVILIPERCKGCGFCIEFCPQGIIARFPEMNRLGYHSVHITDESKCTGCDLCGMVCPDFAIGVRISQDDDQAES
jgi:2-oxoglutarate ferredoxin oxidoreductase subunit delta